MTLDARLARLSTGLSARERVVLYVRAVLEDRPLDPSIRATMPDWQLAEANRLIRLADGILHVLLPQALILQADVEVLGVRFQHLLALAVWGTERTHLRNALALLGVVPVAQSEYDRLVHEGRAEQLPFAEAVELLEVIDERPRGPRTQTAYERELRKLIKAGAVRAHGAGPVEIEVGSLYDWLGRPFVPHPLGAWRYEPLPDAEYERERWRAEFEAVELAREDDGPGIARVPLAGPAADRTRTVAAGPDAARDALADRVRGDLLECWSRLLAIETVSDEALEPLQDERVIPESMHSLLARARLGLIDLYEQGMVLLGIDGFPEADARLVRQLRQALVRDETMLL